MLLYAPHYKYPFIHLVASPVHFTNVMHDKYSSTRTVPYEYIFS